MTIADHLRPVPPQPVFLIDVGAHSCAPHTAIPGQPSIPGSFDYSLSLEGEGECEGEIPASNNALMPGFPQRIEFAKTPLVRIQTHSVIGTASVEPSSG